MATEFTLSTLIPHELNQELEIACTKRGYNKKKAVAEALGGWIGKGASTSAVPGTPPKNMIEFPAALPHNLQQLLSSPETRKPFEQLAEIVNSGNEEAIQVAKSGINIATWGIKIHARKRGKG